jgi:glutathione synthase
MTKKRGAKKAGFLWITDPWETLDHPNDTTIRLAQEALLLGIESHWCDVRSIRWDQDRVVLTAHRFEEIGPGRDPASIQLGSARAASPLDYQSLQYRTDPPVDLAYQHPLQLLHLALEMEPRKSARPEIVNPVQALLIANEKLEAGTIKGLLPPTLVSSQWESLHAFGVTEQKTVLKPLHLAQSKGIELLDWSSDQGISVARQIIEKTSDGFEKPVLLQRYLPGISQGETRLWFLDGKLLACAKKLPLKNDFRVNIDQGSRLAAHSPNAHEKRAATQIGKHLRALGVRLAAVDLIEGFATDFNVTSPGLITQMEKVLGKNLARPIVRALSRRFKS